MGITLDIELLKDGCDGAFGVLAAAKSRLSDVLSTGWCRLGVPGRGEFVPEVGGVETRSKDRI